MYNKIYEIVKMIPRGKVATYGQIAIALGNVHLSQVVGFALHKNPNPKAIPCYRVVNRFGEVSSAFAFGGPDCQKALLEDDGIAFTDDGRVDMEKHLISQDELVQL
ncbi:MAG: MGMT family protein [Oscillospiraceae bacterium]